MGTLRLYSTAIVLLTWAVIWSAGVRGDVVVGIGLLLTGATVIIAEVERAHRRVERR